MSTGRWWRPSARSQKSVSRPRLGLEHLESRDVPAISLISGASGSLSTSGNGLSQAYPPGAISDNGQYVVFTSASTDLVSGQTDSQVTITNATWDGFTIFGFTVGTATITTGSDHGFSVNDIVTVSGVNPGDFNGTFIIDSVPSSTSFTYELDVDPGTYVSGGSIGTTDVFLRDTVNNTTTLISHSYGSSTTTANGDSIVPYISGDGNYVAFFSNATNLVNGASVSGFQLYLYDRVNGTTSLVTHAAGSATTGSTTDDTPQVGQLALSDDGKYIAFISEAQDLITNQSSSNTFFAPDYDDAFLYDRVNDTLSLVSHSTSSLTEGANGLTTLVNISGDGSTVVFTSESTNLFSGQNESTSSTTFDIFRYDVSTDTTTLVTHQAGASDTPTGAANTDLYVASISDDGTRIAYANTADNLVANQVDTSGLFQDTIDIFLYDSTTDTNVMVSHKYGTTATSDSTILGGFSSPPVISGDGNWIAYAIDADELLSTQVDALLDNVYLYDASNGTNALVSHTTNSQTTTTGGAFPSISNDGSYVVYTGVNDDATLPAVVKYTKSDGSVTTVAPLSDSSSGGANAPLGIISGDGTTVIFNSFATNLVSNDNNGSQDVFIAGSDAPSQPTQLTLDSSVIPALDNTTFAQFQITASPAGRIFQYTIDSVNGSANNGQFVVNNGSISTGSSFVSQLTTSYTLVVTVTEPGVPTTNAQFTISNLTVVNAPTALTLTQFQVPDSATTSFSQFQVTGDSSRTYQYTFQNGTGSADNSQFTISGNQLLTGTGFPISSPTTFSIRVRVADSVFPGLFYETALSPLTLVTAPTDITASVVDVPAVVSASGTTVAQFTTTGFTGQIYNYTLVTGTGDDDNAQFVINGNQLQTAATFDTGGQTTLSVRVQVTDSEFPSLSFTKVLTFTVVNAPTDLDLSQSLVPNLASTNFSTITATGPAGRSFTYSLVSGTGDDDNGKFTISGNQLTTNTFPVTGQTSFTVRIRVADSAFPNDLFYEEAFSLTLIAAPTDMDLSRTRVPASDISPFATISTTGDAGRSFTYSLVSGAGSADNAKFAISGNQLVTSSSFPATGQSSFTIRLRTADSQYSGLFYEEQFTLTFVHAPTDISQSATLVPAVRDSVNPAVATLTTVGESGQSYTYSLVAGTGGDDNAQFVINGDKLEAAATFTPGSDSTMTVRVQATDSEFPAMSFTKVLTFTVVAAPTDISLSPTNFTPASSATVGALSVPGSTRSYSYTLVSGTGSTDNGLFSISGSNLVTGSSFPTTTATYSVRVRVTDTAFPSLTFEKVLSPNAVNAPAAPILTVPTQLNGIEGFSFPVTILASPGDLNSTVTVTIANVPAGATFSAGTNNGGGVWTFTQSQLTGLTMKVPDNSSFTLTVTATATFTGGGGSPTSVTKSLPVVIQNAAPSITASAPSIFNPTGVLQLTVSSTDSGQDTPQSVIVNWGDGVVQTFPGGGGTFNHQYPVSDTNYQIVVSVKDEDGTFTLPGGVFVDAELPTPQQAVVSELYLDLLGRSADPGGLANFSGQLAAGASIQQVVTALVNSPEYQQKVVNDLYLKYLGRPADAGGLTSSLSLYQTGGSRAVIMSLASSPEYFALAGGTNQGFITKLYLDVLGRPVDPSGLQSYLSQLSFGVSRTMIVMQLLDSPEGRHEQISLAYETYLGREGDEAGIQSWIPLYASNPTAFLIAFLSTPEYSTRLTTV